MGSTPTYGLPYPDTTSSVDIPRDIKALADAVDAVGVHAEFTQANASFQIANGATGYPTWALASASTRAPCRVGSAAHQIEFTMPGLYAVFMTVRIQIWSAVTGVIEIDPEGTALDIVSIPAAAAGWANGQFGGWLNVVTTSTIAFHLTNASGALNAYWGGRVLVTRLGPKV